MERLRQYHIARDTNAKQGITPEQCLSYVTEYFLMTLEPALLEYAA